MSEVLEEKFQGERPLGVMILAILHIISIPSFALAAAAVSGSAAISILIIVVGLIYFTLAYGLWNGKGWAWSWSVFFQILVIVQVFLSFIFKTFRPVTSLYNLTVAVLIIYYLTRPHVKAFFGKQKISLVDWFLGRTS